MPSAPLLGKHAGQAHSTSISRPKGANKIWMTVVHSDAHTSSWWRRSTQNLGTAAYRRFATKADQESTVHGDSEGCKSSRTWGKRASTRMVFCRCGGLRLTEPTSPEDRRPPRQQDLSGASLSQGAAQKALIDGPEGPLSRGMAFPHLKSWASLLPLLGLTRGLPGIHRDNCVAHRRA